SQDLVRLYYLESLSNRLKKCALLKVFRIDHTTIDVACDINCTVSELYVYWESEPSLCSVYINAGMNLLLHQYVNATDEDYEHSSYVLNDGDTNQSRCIKAQGKKTTVLWNVFLDEPKHINFIVIYSSFTYSITGFGGHENREMFQLVHTSEQNAMFLIPYSSFSYLTRLQLVVYPNQKLNTTLCEIEAFGECSPPKYGITCSKICSQDCTDQRCHFNGECYKGSSAGVENHVTSPSPPELKPNAHLDSSNFFTIVLVLTLGLSGAFMCIICVYRIINETLSSRGQTHMSSSTASYGHSSQRTSQSTSATTTANTGLRIKRARFKYVSTSNL
ncbi:cell death abnormality protein 1, partial [Biomphalaria pfeifferi]